MTRSLHRFGLAFLFAVSAVFATSAQGLLSERWSTPQDQNPVGIYFGGGLVADWDGDGVPDILDVLVGNLVAGPELQRIVSGDDGSVLADLPTNLFVPPPGVGIPALPWRSAVHGLIDDVDGDGVADIAILRNKTATGSLLELRSGGTLIPIATLVWTTTTDGLWPRGIGIVPVGDMNGDGIGELAVQLSDNQDSTELRIVDPSAGVQLANISGPALPPMTQVLGRDFASTVVPVGDVNGDGLSDFVHGGTYRYPFAGTQPTDPASAWRLVLGGSFTAGWEVISTVGSTNPRSGRRVVVGDRDGDGHRDILVEKSRLSGTWTILSSATGTTIVDLGVVILPLGEMRTVGDVNADGAPDFIMDSPWPPFGNFIIDGDDFGQVRGLGELQDFVSFMGDLNGDGAGEIAVTDIGIVSAPAPSPLQRRVISLQGHEAYGDLSAPLALSYVRSQTAPRVLLEGATPNATLLVGASFAPAHPLAVIAGFPLAINLAETFSLTTVSADASGEWRQWFSLEQPLLEGVAIFLQVVETGTNLHSNGLELLFQG